MISTSEQALLEVAREDDAGNIVEVINRLTDEFRDQALWFLREDYYPTTLEARLRVLEYIDQRGDVATFKRVAKLRRCLLQTSNEKSAA